MFEVRILHHFAGIRAIVIDILLAIRCSDHAEGRKRPLGLHTAGTSDEKKDAFCASIQPLFEEFILSDLLRRFEHVQMSSDVCEYRQISGFWVTQQERRWAHNRTSRFTTSSSRCVRTGEARHEMVPSLLPARIGLCLQTSC